MDGAKNLDAVGQRGIDVVNKPEALDDAELSLGQNVEIRMTEGEGALEPRRGFARLGSQIVGGIMSMLFDVPVDRPADKVPYLYAALASDVNGHQFRYSADGVTWTYDLVVAGRIGCKIPGVSPFKNVPKVVTIRSSLYYCDNAVPINIHKYDGVIDLIIGTIPPTVFGVLLATPSAPAVTRRGAAGATTYTYKVVAVAGATHSAASAAASVTTDVVTLDANHFNSFALGVPVAGATSYDIYRTAGGATQGKIGTIPISGGAFTQGNGSGLTGDSLPPTDNSGNGVALIINAAGTQGSTHYEYVTVARDATHGCVSVGSAPGTINYGNAVLDATNYNYISGSYHDLFISGMTSIDVYRTVGGPTQGKIGNFATPGGVWSLSNAFRDTGLVGDGTTPPTLPVGVQPDPYGNQYQFTDAGLAGDSTTAPTTATGLTSSEALGVLDMITDGASLFMALYDSPQVANPNGAVGRVMQFNPFTGAWIQIGPAFPQTAPAPPRTDYPKGTPGAILMYGGSLVYGTYGEDDDGTGKRHGITSLDYPNPITLENQITDRSTCALATFNGALFTGMAHLLHNATNYSACIFKRDQTTGAYTLDYDLGLNGHTGFTSIAVHAGKLLAAWCPGNTGNIGSVIVSSGNGVWAVEKSFNNTNEVPGQMIVAPDGNLYLVLGDATQPTPSTRILRRTPAGVWTEVDPNNANFKHAGAIGVLYR